jgi:hypothetical protein
MWLNLDIDFDDTTFRKQLKLFGKREGNVAKKMITAVAYRIRRESKRYLRVRGAGIKERSGKLYNSVNYYAFKDFGMQIFAKLYYSTTLENGAVINAKNTKYLTFYVDGQWKKVKSVTIVPKPFLKPIFNKYWDGDAKLAIALMNNVLQKELDKLFQEDKK